MIDGPRACQASEFEEVIALINQVFRAGTNQDIRTDYPLVFNQSKMEYMRILKVDGVVVAHVPVWLREAVVGDDRLRIGIICPTVTHPDYRRHGYATLCLQDCIRIMEEEGSPIFRTMDAGGNVSFLSAVRLGSGWVAGLALSAAPGGTRTF